MDTSFLLTKPEGQHSSLNIDTFLATGNTSLLLSTVRLINPVYRVRSPLPHYLQITSSAYFLNCMDTLCQSKQLR